MMGINFKEGLEGFSRLPPENVMERLGSLAADFERAEERGVLVPLPDVEPDRSRDISRIRTIRNRLANLGYEVEDSGPAVLGDELREAIRCFQREAGLTVDGWVGNEETWPALQELVSFETPINIRRWLEGGRPNRALRRAVTLRLFVLGLFDRKPISPDHNVSEGFEAFGRIWQILRFNGVTTSRGLSVEWIERLFNEDGLVERLATAPVPASIPDLMKVHGFVLNVAKIELWLSGYSVRPTGYEMEPPRTPIPVDGDLDKIDVWMKSASVSKFLRIKKNLSFYRALTKFWQDQGEEAEAVDHLSLDFLDTFPRFFQAVQNGIRADAHLSDAERQKLIETTIQKYPDQVPTIWSYVRTLGNRIWDGMRRAWGWLKNLLKKTAQKVITIGRNLSRLIYHYVLGGYTVVSNILKGFGTSVQFFIQSHLEISDSRTGIISHDKDFDFRMTLDGEADPISIRALCVSLRRQTRLFLFICKILRVFISILSTVVKNVHTGYLGLILALVRFRREWEEILSLMREYEAIFENRD